MKNGFSEWNKWVHLIKPSITISNYRYKQIQNFNTFLPISKNEQKEYKLVGYLFGCPIYIKK